MKRLPRANPPTASSVKFLKPPFPEMEDTLHHCEPLDSRQFLLAVKRLAESLSYGTDRSPFLGQGIEYVQSRRYEPGDPVKSIN